MMWLGRAMPSRCAPWYRQRRQQGQGTPVSAPTSPVRPRSRASLSRASEPATTESSRTFASPFGSRRRAEDTSFHLFQFFRFDGEGSSWGLPGLGRLGAGGACLREDVFKKGLWVPLQGCSSPCRSEPSRHQTYFMAHFDHRVRPSFEPLVIVMKSSRPGGPRQQDASTPRLVRQDLEGALTLGLAHDCDDDPR